MQRVALVVLGLVLVLVVVPPPFEAQLSAVGEVQAVPDCFSPPPGRRAP